MRYTAVVFDKGDAPFFDWMAKHPDGLVLNLHRQPGTKYAVLHRSTCNHIGGYTSVWPKGAFTERDYIKVCAEHGEAIKNWLVQNRKHLLNDLHSCKSCNPPGLPVTKEEFIYPDEVPAGTAYAEGGVKRVQVNAFERDPRAREACLSHYGYDCSVCGMNFAEVYGEPGNGFIHVHHLLPLSKVRTKKEVDPIRDMRPVCPNCHAMLHRRDPPFSIRELKSMLRKTQEEASK